MLVLESTLVWDITLTLFLQNIAPFVAQFITRTPYYIPFRSQYPSFPENAALLRSAPFLSSRIDPIIG